MTRGELCGRLLIFLKLLGTRICNICQFFSFLDIYSFQFLWSMSKVLLSHFCGQTCVAIWHRFLLHHQFHLFYYQAFPAKYPIYIEDNPRQLYRHPCHSPTSSRPQKTNSWPQTPLKSLGPRSPNKYWHQTTFIILAIYYKSCQTGGAQREYRYWKTLVQYCDIKSIWCHSKMCPLFWVMHLISPEVVDFLLKRVIEKKWKELVRKMWILENWAPHQNSTIPLSLNDKSVITSQPWNMKHPPSLCCSREATWPHLTKLSPIYWAPERVSTRALQHTNTETKTQDVFFFYKIEPHSLSQHAPNNNNSSLFKQR